MYSEAINGLHSRLMRTDLLKSSWYVRISAPMFRMTCKRMYS